MIQKLYAWAEALDRTGPVGFLVAAVITTALVWLIVRVVRRLSA